MREGPCGRLSERVLGIGRQSLACLGDLSMVISRGGGGGGGGAHSGRQAKETTWRMMNRYPVGNLDIQTLECPLLTGCD